MPATFRAIAFVATELDARPGRTLRRAHRTMSEAELAEIVRVLRSVPESVAAWSDGTAGFDAFEIRVIDEPVRHLSATGPDRFWVGPRDIASVIDRHVGRGKWDNVFLVHPTDGSYPQCGWGCSIGPSAAANGAGFSSIVSDRWQADHVRLFPEEGFVHEWLHQVEGTYRNHGLPLHELPDLHDVDGRTSATAGDRGAVRPWLRRLRAPDGHLAAVVSRPADRDGRPEGRRAGARGHDPGAMGTSPADALMPRRRETWPRPAKIAFIGSHGIRKTSALLAFAAVVQRAGRSVELGREVVRDNPLGINERATGEAQLWVLVSQIRQELELARRADVLATDRGVMDNYAYYLRANGGIDRFDVEPLVRRWSETYDLVVRLLPDIALQADGVRRTNDAFRDEVEAILDEVLPGLVHDERLVTLRASEVTSRTDWFLVLQRLAASIGATVQPPSIWT